MKSWSTQKNCQITQILSGRSNAYLIEKEDNIILVDTGKKSALKKLSQNLKKLNIDINRINCLVLTHTHFDHCQSAWEIKEKSGCKIIVSGKASEFIQDGYTPLPHGTNMFTKLISGAGKFVGKRNFGYTPFKPDVLIENDFVPDNFGSKIKIIETPGHSVDSISLLLDEEIAIVGDTVFGIFKNSVFPPFSDDIEKMIESWRKLLNSNCSVFLPGHGKEIKRDLLQNEYLKYNQL